MGNPACSLSRDSAFQLGSEGDFEVDSEVGFEPDFDGTGCPSLRAFVSREGWGFRRSTIDPSPTRRRFALRPLRLRGNAVLSPLPSLHRKKLARASITPPAKSSNPANYSP